MNESVGDVRVAVQCGVAEGDDCAAGRLQACAPRSLQDCPTLILTASVRNRIRAEYEIQAMRHKIIV